jgi:hypothetical protein
VVLAAATAERFEGARAELRRLARTLPLWAAGAGATPDAAAATGAKLLDVDPFDAAQRVATIRSTGD